ncbi:MAG: hypothetical protein BWY74_04562 [Firmicutes bacterium ADurb.Bin419]|nr:MAG: hypothetical protein BWY74_04562 [Firmicutes bacterium ADurb.Bin419]
MVFKGSGKKASGTTAPETNITITSFIILIPQVDWVYKQMVATKKSIQKLMSNPKITPTIKNNIFIPITIAPPVSKYTSIKVGKNVVKNDIRYFPE